MSEHTQSEFPPADNTEPSAAEGQQESPPESSNGSNKTKTPKATPTKPLATNRIAYPRQFDTLRAFVLSSPTGQPASLGEVSAHSDLSVNTLSTITTFFVAANLLKKSEGHRFTPTEASIEFERAYHWNKETAAHALAPALEDTWFGQAVLNRLKMRGSMTVPEAHELLASEASASPEYKAQIGITLDWLITTGVVEKDGTTLKLGRRVHPKPPAHPPAPPKPPTDKHGDTQMSARSGSTTDEAGNISLNVAIRIDVKELMAMTPDRITAFFAGLAAVVSAKGGME